MRVIRIVGFCLLVVCLLSIRTTGAKVKMNLDPPRVELSMKPGQETGGEISIFNYNDNESMHVRAYVNDLVYLPDGSNDFLPPGSTPWSCSEWIKIGPTEFDVGPGQEGTLRYVITVPDDATGGRYGVIFFEMYPSLSELRDRSGATVNLRLGSIVLVEVEGTEFYRAALQGMDIKRSDADSGAYTISCTVLNDSNILVRPNGTVKIVDEKDREIAEVPLNENKTGVFPKTSRTFYTTYSGAELEKGAYHLQAILDYGGEAYLGGQKRFTID